MTLSEDMREQYARLLRGDLSAAASSPVFEALAQLLGHDPPKNPSDDARARAHDVLAAFLRHDAPFIASAGARSDDSVFGRIVRQWDALYRGQPLLDERLVVDAVAEDEAFAAVVAQSQRALHALRERDAARATMLARRASRMARVEGLLAAEYLANLVLARARRHSGHAFLSLRIGSALEKVLPPIWRRWLSWELLFAGGPQQAAQVVGAMDGAAGEVLGLLNAAMAGARAEYEELRAHIMSPGHLPAGLRADVDALDVLLDPVRPSETHGTFLFGERPDYPITLTGWPSHVGAAIGVCVLVRPGHRGRRVLPTKLAFEGEPDDEVAFVVDGERKSRVHAFLSALALTTGHRIGEAALFEQVWGFPFVPDKHQTLLKTVVARARADIGGICEIQRGGGELSLFVQRPFAIADPRCRPSLNDRLLSALASSGGRVSAKLAAEQLGVSVRYVQSALKNLVEDGACERVKEGRNVEYALEDTTFDQPTLSRLTPSVK